MPEKGASSKRPPLMKALRGTTTMSCHESVVAGFALPASGSSGSWLSSAPSGVTVSSPGAGGALSAGAAFESPAGAAFASAGGAPVVLVLLFANPAPAPSHAQDTDTKPQTEADGRSLHDPSLSGKWMS